MTLRRARLASSALVIGAALSACFLTMDFDYQTGSLRPGDAAEGTARGFALRVDPPALAGRQGGAVRLHVVIDREAGFVAPVGVTIASPPPGIRPNAITVDGGATDGWLDIAIGAAAPGRIDLEVVGAASADNAAHLHVSLDVDPAGGGLDPSFGDGGILELPPLASVEALVVQSDGQILAAGHRDLDGGTQASVVRIATTGSLDGTFMGGKSLGNGSAVDLELVADGKILVATRDDAASTSTVIRLRSDGTLDTTYASSGTYRTGANASLVASGDREIVATAYTPLFRFNGDAVRLARLTSKGALDQTWGSRDAGIIDTPLDGVPADVALDGDGQTIAVANDGTTRTFGITRYDPSGVRDRTFGDAGIVVGAFPTLAGYATVHRLLVADGGAPFHLAGEQADEAAPRTGRAPSLRMVLARFESDGALDPSFGVAGFVVLGSLPTSWANDAVAVGDGSLMLVGGRLDPDGQHAAIVHVAGDGGIDPTYGSPAAAAGTGVALAVAGAAEARCGALDPTGRLLVGGSTGDGNTRAFVARLLP